MLLPFPNERRPSAAPVITWILIAATTSVSLYEIATTHNGSIERAGIAFAFGVIPLHIRPITFVSYSFIHANIGHLLVNLVYLWVFGAGVESALGRWRVVLLYLLGGAFGVSLQVLVALKAPNFLNPALPIIGASASCSCLIGLYAVRYYRDRITFVGIPYRPNVVEVITLFLCLEVTVGLWELFVGMQADGVAHWAHIGGFVFGLTCAYLLNMDMAGQTAYLNEDAAVALDRSRPGAAVARLEDILSRNPNDADARAELARAWLAFRDLDQSSRQFIEAIRLLLSQNRRRDAAYLFCEMRASLPATECQELPAPNPAWTSTLTPQLTAAELFAVGIVLEEVGASQPAAEALRAVSVRDPDSTEAETALLKVIQLYTRHLDRKEEARILLRLFCDRYPNTALRARVEELRSSL